MAESIRQIQCWSDWSEYTPTGGQDKNEEMEPSIWSMNSEFDYGQVLFHTTTTQEDWGRGSVNWQYYNEYWDEDHLETLWDVCLEPRHFLAVENTSKTTKNVIDDIDNYITNNDISLQKFSSNIVLKFKLKQYNRPVSFSVVLKNKKSESKLMVQKYDFKSVQNPKEEFLFISQASINAATFVNFDQILFVVDRDKCPDLTLEFSMINLLELPNLLNLQENEYVSSMTIETLGIGECVFYINNDIFHIGNDHILNIPIEMGVDIYNLNYVKYIRQLPNNDSASISNDKKFITCLINYTVEKGA